MRPVGRGGRVASAPARGDTTDDDYRPDQGGREPKRVATEGRKHTKIDSHAASDPADLQKSREAHYGSWYVNPPGRAEPGRHLVESRERRLARRDDPANEIHVRPLTIRPLAADTRVSSDPCGYSSSSTSLAQPTERIKSINVPQVGFRIAWPSYGSDSCGDRRGVEAEDIAATVAARAHRG